MPVVDFGQWMPDLPVFQNEGLTSLANGKPEARGYARVQDLVEDSDALSGQAIGAFSAIDDNRTAYNFAADAGDIYLRSANAWSVVSQGGGYSVQADEYWEFETFGDNVIAVAHAEDPQVYEIGVSTLFADLSAAVTATADTAPQARHIAAVRDFVVLGNVIDVTDGEVPYRVHWSPIADPEGNWTPSLATLAGRQDLGGNGGWVQRIVGGEFGIVFQERSIWRMTLAGVPVIWQFDEIEQAQGTPAPASVVKRRNIIYYLGQDGFYMTNGGGPSTPIGRNRVDKFFFDDVQAEEIINVQGKFDINDQLIYWSYGGANAMSGVPNRQLIYSITDNKWGLQEIDLELMTAFRTEGLDMDTGLNALYPNLDLVPLSLDNPAWAAGRLLLSGFSPDHKSGAFGGAGLPATFETGQHQIVPGKRALVQNLRPLLDGVDVADPPSIACNISGEARNEGAPVFQASDTTADDEGDCPVLEAGRYFRFRMALGAGTFKSAHGIDVDQFEKDGDH